MKGTTAAAINPKLWESEFLRAYCFPVMIDYCAISVWIGHVIKIDYFAGLMVAKGVHTHTGEFGAHMLVEIANDGPVTIWIER